MSLCRTAHFVWEGGVYQRHSAVLQLLWKSTLSIKRTKNSVTPDFLFRNAKSMALLYSLITNSAFQLHCWSRNPLKNARTTQQVRWRNHSWLGGSSSVLYCPLALQHNLCPQFPPNLAQKTLCKSHISLQSQRCSSEWYTCICILKQTRNQSSRLHLFFSPREKTTGSHFTRLPPSLSYYLIICTTKMRAKQGRTCIPYFNKWNGFKAWISKT